MTIKHLFILTAMGSSLLTSCMTPEKWVDDDVYVVKSVEIPTDTDISDETDYNAYVYNRRNNTRHTTYYNDPFFSNSSWMLMSGFGWNRYNSFGWGMHGGYSGYWGMNSMYGYSPFYDPYWGGYYSPYGYYGTPYYGYYGNPYYGYNGGYYGYNNGYYNNNNGYPVGGATTSGIHVRGPRGSSAGYGGVRSNSPMAYKSTKAPASASTDGRTAVNTVSKPVTTYERVGRNTRPITVRQTAGSTNTVSRSPGTTPVARSSENTSSVARVPRPASTTTRNNSGSGSVSRAGNGGGSYNSGNSSRNSQGSTISNGGGSSRQVERGGSGVSGGGGNSGSSRSGGGSGSSGGTKPVGRR